MATERIQPHVKKEHDQSISEGKTYTPYIDIAETGAALIVTMDSPGVNRERLDVTLEKDHLRVDGEISYGI